MPYRICDQLFCCLLFAAIPAVLYAQFDTGQIGGYVRDASQAVVTGEPIQFRRNWPDSIRRRKPVWY
jgi:hypothetical protein